MKKNNNYSEVTLFLNKTLSYLYNWNSNQVMNYSVDMYRIKMQPSLYLFIYFFVTFFLSRNNLNHLLMKHFGLF